MAKRKHRRPEAPVTRRQLLRALDRLKQDLTSAIVNSSTVEPEPPFMRSYSTTSHLLGGRTEKSG